MVAFDHQALIGQRIGRLTKRNAPLVRGTALGSVLIVVGALITHGFSDNGFRLASQLAWRYAFFIFFLALVAGPLARIAGWLFVRFGPPDTLGRHLVWGFCASYAIYLLAVFVPNAIQPSAGAGLMILFGAAVVLVMALTAKPLARLSGPALMSNKVRRVLLGTSVAYFWSCYFLMGLVRICGPHRPDSYYGLSLCLMIAGLLVRYADWWIITKRAYVTG